MSMSNTYWNRKGRYESFASQLRELIPEEGSVGSPRKNPKLEKFRKACNCYYDLYNNGLCNRAREFSSVFKIRSSDYRGFYSFRAELYSVTESKMDEIVLAAYAEQFPDRLKSYHNSLLENLPDAV